jgi:hypothetical protein
MRRNARVAFVLWRTILWRTVLWRAGPPRGHEATPDRTVRRPYWGAANLRDCRHARLVWGARNESRVLSLMSALEVNSGTGLMRQYACQVNSGPKSEAREGVCALRSSSEDPRQSESPALGEAGLSMWACEAWGTSDVCLPGRKKVQQPSSRHMIEFSLVRNQRSGRTDPHRRYAPTLRTKS